MFRKVRYYSRSCRSSFVLVQVGLDTVTVQVEIRCCFGSGRSGTILAQVGVRYCPFSGKSGSVLLQVGISYCSCPGRSDSVMVRSARYSSYSGMLCSVLVQVVQALF